MADVMADYFGEHCFSYSAKLSMDLIDLNGCHSSARKLFDTAQCGDKFGIIFVLCHCRKTKECEKRREEWKKLTTYFVFRRGIQFYITFTYFEVYYVIHIVFCYL